jgi:hypothetical protein
MPVASPEYITCEPGALDAWVCLCGNTPAAEGFYPCDALGKEVEPTPADWTTGSYVCARCGRIISQKSLEVVGRRAMQAERANPSL